MSFQTKPANQRHELASDLSIACPTQGTVFIQPQSDSPASRASLKSLLAAIPESTQVTIDCTRINSISDYMLQVMWGFKGDGQLHITSNHLAEFQAKRGYLEKAEPIKKEGGQSHGTYKLKRSKLQITTDPAVPPSDNYQELWAGWIENIPTNKPSINTVVATANSDVKWDTNLDIPSSQKPRSNQPAFTFQNSDKNTCILRVDNPDTFQDHKAEFLERLEKISSDIECHIDLGALAKDTAHKTDNNQLCTDILCIAAKRNKANAQPMNLTIPKILATSGMKATLLQRIGIKLEVVQD